SPDRGKPRNGTDSAERWIWNSDGGTIFGREHDPGRRPRGGDDFGRHSLGVSRVRAQASDATVRGWMMPASLKSRVRESQVIIEMVPTRTTIPNHSLGDNARLNTTYPMKVAVIGK